MAQDTAAYDGQVSVAADEVVGEDRDKVQQLGKGRPVDLHRDMLGIKNNTVLVVIHIRAVLQKPIRPGNFQRDDPVVLPCRVVHSSGIALIFRTQQALGITGLGGVLGSRNGLGVFFRLTEVDGNIQFPILRSCFPPHILFDAVAADIICILRETVVPLRGRLWGFLIQC